MVNETMLSDHYAVTEYIINEKIQRIQELEAINAELLGALETAIAELHECAMELTGEPYNNPKFNKLLAKAKGAAS